MASKRKDRRKKKAFGRRLGERARAVGLVGRDAVTRPSSLPGQAHGWFRRWFARIWSVRGGGLYALGFAITFLILEVRSLADDVAESATVGGFFGQQIFEFVVRFASDSFVNTILAFIWPIFVIQMAPVWGSIGLVIAFLTFSHVLKKPIERWLFGDVLEHKDTRS